MMRKGYWFCVAVLCVAGARGENAEPVLPEVPKAAMPLPENQWVRIGDMPPDPLARELEPGRGAFLCYEPGGGKFLRYGGYTPTDCNALWTYDLAARQWENPLPVDYAWPPPIRRSRNWARALSGVWPMTANAMSSGSSAAGGWWAGRTAS